jgi:flagellar biosynthesis/type III secretory pathway protein FliH
LRALKYIIEADLNDEILSQKYQRQDKEIAQIIYDAIINVPTKNEYHFRVHTKGVGIFCNMKSGIKKDSLVVEYFGEIYRPWHWFEKQDVIK